MVSVSLFVRLFVCRLKRILVGHWPDWLISAGSHVCPERCWASRATLAHWLVLEDSVQNTVFWGLYHGFMQNQRISCIAASKASGKFVNTPY